MLKLEPRHERFERRTFYRLDRRERRHEPHGFTLDRNRFPPGGGIQDRFHGPPGHAAMPPDLLDRQRATLELSQEHGLRTPIGARARDEGARESLHQHAISVACGELGWKMNVLGRGLFANLVWAEAPPFTRQRCNSARPRQESRDRGGSHKISRGDQGAAERRFPTAVP
jgi:hypothetical protein